MSLSRSLKILPILFSFFLIASCSFPDKDKEKPAGHEKFKKIKVVMDNNYPPFIFIDSSGKQQGILVEHWQLWAKKTGVEVEIMAKEWHEALEIMKKGEADVIDTIFFNEQRALIYDFTEPYANIDVPIFFNKKISGIKDAETAKGFSIAVKKGDNALVVLKEHGIDSLLEFDSYEEIMIHAKENKITVFVVDAPPAFYFLYKMGIQDEFNYSSPLYSGAFHRAVKKGDKELLNLIEFGFSKISRAEYDEIEKKWYGTKSIINSDTITYIISFFAFFILITAVLFIWNRTLKKQVSLKTRALEQEMERSLKKTEELAHNEEVFRSTIESMDDLIFILDTKNRFTEFHQTSKRKELLMPEEAFLGKSIDEIGLSEEVVNGYNTALVKLKKSGKSQTYEYGMTIMGEKKWYAAKLSDRKDTSGNYDGSTVVVRDITAQKNLESEKERILAHLEMKNIELEKIIYAASHDLRSPLLNIHGFSMRIEKALGEIFSLMENSTIDDNLRESIRQIIEDRIKNALKYITSSVSRMDSLINGLIKLSRSGGKEPNKVIIDMDNMMARIISSMKFQIESTGAEVKLDKLPPCKGDFAQITQVFSNILDNAIKYKDQNRHIEVFIRGREENDMAVYSVSDTGRGIAKDDQKKIWEVFQRLESDEKINGDGLGLAISKKIIETHGGKISVESIPGQGSTFFVALELAK